MRRFLLLLSALWICSYLHSQEQTVISADRPGMATGVDVLSMGSIQWETGFQYDFEAGSHALTLPTTMLRIGIAPFAELRLEYDGQLSSDDGKAWQYAVCPLVFGTKVRIFDGSEEHRWIPRTSLLVNLAIPSTKEQAQTTHVAPSAYLLFHNDLADWLGIDYNIGAEWNGTDAVPTTFLALCLGFGISDEVGAFVESYNYITRDSGDTRAEAFLDFGFNFLVHPRVQLDCYGAFNCREPRSSASAGIGIAWMIR